jgi:hypothetical protein
LTRQITDRLKGLFYHELLAPLSLALEMTGRCAKGTTLAESERKGPPRPGECRENCLQRMEKTLRSENRTDGNMICCKPIGE